MKHITIVLLLSLQFWGVDLYAQEGDSRTFYEKNYAAVPQVGSKKLEGDLQPQGNAPRPQGGHNQTSDNSSPPNTQDSRTVGGLTNGNSASSSRFHVDLYANSIDRAHFERALNALIEAAKTRPIDVNYVHQMGDYRNITQPMKDRAAQVGLTIVPISQLPNDLPVDRSPAWVITTPAGRYILEGVFNISRFINENGEFTTAVPRPTPQPTIGMGGF